MAPLVSLTWLHISDLHLREKPPYEENRILQALLRDVAEHMETGPRPDFIAVTGDIAYSANPYEYELAERFFDDLLAATGLTRGHLFPVPGNHDVDRKLISRGAQAIGDSLGDSRGVAEVLDSQADRELMLRRFEGYGRFVNRYFGDIIRFDDENYYYVRALPVGLSRVAILGLNSAWASSPRDDEVRGLILGARQVEAALQLADSADADLSIALMHHPFHLLRPFDQRDSALQLSSGVDFVLHGHHHDVSNTLVQEPDVRATIIGAGACYETKELPNSYNFVRLLLSEGEGHLYLRAYSDQKGGFWTQDLTTFPSAPGGVWTFPLRLDWKPPAEQMTEEEAAPEQVYVRELYVDNFRCFEQEEFVLSPGFTVLIGDNASGKSTILEALVLGVGAFFLGIDGVEPPAIRDEQARLVPYSYGQTATLEPQYPVRVACVGSWGEQELKWAVLSKGRDHGIERTEAEEVAELARRLQARVRQGRETVLPLIAYYSTGRVWRAPESSPEELDSPGSRFQGYDHCLDPASHVGNMMRWMKTQEMIATSEKAANQVYEAVKAAIRSCVEDLTDVQYNLRLNDLYAIFGDDRALPFRMLSEGVRNMLAMVADIAHRAALLNPQFGTDAARLTPGIVLIDELDLHLHPRWQQRVANDLSRAFPRVQFLATTHSPLIVGGLPPEQVFRLRPDGAVPLAESVQGWRADQILTSPAFGLESTRDPETEALIASYSRLAVRDDLDDADKAELEAAARELDLRLPSSAEKEEAREAYEGIQSALLERWLEHPVEEREKLAREVQAQLLESVMGARRPS